MKQYYYVDKNGDVQGPLPLPELLKLRDAGELKDETYVKEEENESQWQKFGDVLPGEETPKSPDSTPIKGPAEAPVNDLVAQLEIGSKQSFFCKTPETNDISGPFTVDELRRQLARRVITSDHEILVAKGQSLGALNASKDWQKIGSLIASSEKPEGVAWEVVRNLTGGSGSADATDEALRITRRSGWATFSVVLAVLSGIVAFGGVIALSEGNDAGLVILVVGIAGCVQCAFLSFLINVVTDIRWFLSELAGTDKRGPE